MFTKKIFKRFGLISALLIAVLVMTLMLAACPTYGPYWKDISDFYGEYKFTLPFETTDKNYAGIGYFKTNYSMEEMQQKIKYAGYGAELYEFEGTKRILISAVYGYKTAYFVIHDQFGTFALDALGYGTSCFQVLFPFHLTSFESESPDSNRYHVKVRVYATFGEIADFYRQGGQNDFTIDEDNLMITVSSAYRHAVKSDKISVTIKWEEDEDDNKWLILNAPEDCPNCST